MAALRKTWRFVGNRTRIVASTICCTRLRWLLAIVCLQLVTVAWIELAGSAPGFGTVAGLMPMVLLRKIRMMAVLKIALMHAAMGVRGIRVGVDAIFAASAAAFGGVTVCAAAVTGTAGSAD